MNRRMFMQIAVAALTNPMSAGGVETSRGIVGIEESAGDDCELCEETLDLMAERLYKPVSDFTIDHLRGEMERVACPEGHSWQGDCVYSQMEGFEKEEFHDGYRSNVGVLWHPKKGKLEVNVDIVQEEAFNLDSIEVDLE